MDSVILHRNVSVFEALIHRSSNLDFRTIMSFTYNVWFLQKQDDVGAVYLKLLIKLKKAKVHAAQCIAWSI